MNGKKQLEEEEMMQQLFQGPAHQALHTNCQHQILRARFKLSQLQLEVGVTVVAPKLLPAEIITKHLFIHLLMTFIKISPLAFIHVLNKSCRICQIVRACAN